MSLGYSPSGRGFTDRMLKLEGALEMLCLVLCFYTFFFFQRGSFFFVLPEFYFEAIDLEGIKAKLPWLNGGQMEGQESHLFSLPITHKALLWGLLIQSNDLFAQWGN